MSTTKPKKNSRDGAAGKGPAARPVKKASAQVPPKLPIPQKSATVPAAKRAPAAGKPAPVRSSTSPAVPQKPGAAKTARNQEKRQHSYYLECNQVALPFAVRRTDSVREVDAALVSAISEPSNVLQSIEPAKRTWDSVRARMSSGLMRSRAGPTAAPTREEQLVVKHSKWFVAFGQYKDMPGRVREWFAKVVADPDVVAARADVDLNSIEAVASHAGRVTAASLIFKKEHKEKQLVDVGVIRYPEPKQPYVKAYRIELTAWYDSTIIFGYTFDTNGVKARINVEEFEPSGKAAPSRRPTDNRLAVAQADALFA